MSSPEAELRPSERTLKLGIVVMSIAAIVWLTYQFQRLLLEPGVTGAIDLRQRYDEVALWFAGKPVYGVYAPATYPPATLLLLWPFVGWPSFTIARWLWAGTTIAALFWLIRIVVDGSGARGRLERAFVALLPLSAYATGATIGNGQLIVLVLPCLVTAIAMARRGGLTNDLAAASLFVLALVKPSAAAPFFWLLLFTTGSTRPAALVVLGYAAITALAASFQPMDPLPLMRTWLAASSRVLATTAVKFSNGNVHALLTSLGKPGWIAPSSLVMIALLGVWTYRHRRTDVWVSLGVAALVCRLYTYHGWYDDLLVLLPMVALIRWLTDEAAPRHVRQTAKVLFTATLLFAMAPGGLYLLPAPFNRAYVAVQTVIWVAVLGFLASRPRAPNRNEHAAATHGMLPPGPLGTAMALDRS